MFRPKVVNIWKIMNAMQMRHLIVDMKKMKYGYFLIFREKSI